MKKLSIAQRVAIATGFLCLVIAGLSLFTAARFSQLRTISHSVSDDSVPAMESAAEFDRLQRDNYALALQMEMAETAEERAAIKKEMAVNTAAETKALEQYQKSVNDEEDRKAFATVEATHVEYQKLRDQYFGLIESNPEAARKFAFEKLKPAFDTYSHQVAGLLSYNSHLVDQSALAQASMVDDDLKVIVIVGVLALVIGAASAVLVSVKVNRALSRIAHSLGEGSEQVAAAAAQVSTASQSLASGSSEQAASLEETSSSLEEVASMSRHTGDNATQAKTVSEAARAAADAGATKMTEMRQAMDAIQTSSAEVSKIIKTIDEIAFQTNILALNAAVEAARAGEAGAGFAIVADEVRNLAQRTAGAAKETASKIEDAVQRSTHGVQVSVVVAKALGEIVDQANKVATLITEIDSASREQIRGLNQVNEAVNQINKVVQSNTSSAEESAAAAEELNAQAVAQRFAVDELLLLAGAAKSGSASRPVAQSRGETPLMPARESEKRQSPPDRQGTSGRRQRDVHQETKEPGSAVRHHPTELDLTAMRSAQPELDMHFKDVGAPR